MVSSKEKALPAWDSHSLEEELEGCHQQPGVEMGSLMGHAPCNTKAHFKESASRSL